MQSREGRSASSRCGKLPRRAVAPRSVVAASIIASWCAAGHAAQVAPDELERLTRQAQQKGAVRVMVAFDVGASLDALARRPAAIRAATDQKAQVLLAELGAEAWEGGRWRNGLGQMGLYVTPAGLQRLAATSNAQSFAADPTGHYRVRGNEADGSHRAIEAALARQGEVDVEVVLETDEGEPDIEPGGRARFKRTKAMDDELQARLARINQKPWSRRLKNVDGAGLGESASFKARIDKEAFAALRESEEVRAVRPVGFVDARPARWSAAALSEARAKGSADVIVTLRGGSTFSPKSGDMSVKAWRAQGRANARVLAELLRGDESGARALARLADDEAALGSINARLSLKTLERLSADADPRVLSVDLNKPIAGSALANSTRLVNIASAWNAGYRAAGQSIIVMDSGIKKDHAFFKRADGTSKVTYEACFGSDSAPFVSYCSGKDGQGDSPLGLPGSGEPVGDASLCAMTGTHCGHGTHVAGIAAGRASAEVAGGTVQGMAPDANLISARIFSYVPASGAVGVFPADLAAALNAVFAATVPGHGNPYVVNMSLGGAVDSEDCAYQSQAITSAVANLASRGVPVVAATGNNYYTNSIAFPACIPNVIKVSAIANDATGVTRADFANVASPEDFTGPMLFAPGGSDITSVSSADSRTSNGLMARRGTSMAAPHVAGLYAAVKAASPGITVADATAWIMSNATVEFPVTRPAPDGTRMFRRVRLPNF